MITIIYYRGGRRLSAESRKSRKTRPKFARKKPPATHAVITPSPPPPTNTATDSYTEYVIIVVVVVGRDLLTSHINNTFFPI